MGLVLVLKVVEPLSQIDLFEVDLFKSADFSDPSLEAMNKS